MVIRMLDWLKARRSVNPQPTDTAAAHAEPTSTSGRSEPLYRYLDGRYADGVTLTFKEIEDLTGFALPDAARQSSDWWTTPAADGGRSRFSDSWIQAKRTARPNLLALTVAFNRAG